MEKKPALKVLLEAQLNIAKNRYIQEKNIVINNIRKALIIVIYLLLFLIFIALFVGFMYGSSIVGLFVESYDGGVGKGYLAGWYQAYFALATLIVTVIIAIVANRINETNMLERAIKEREIFSQITNDRAFCGKKALYNNRFKLRIKKLETELDSFKKEADKLEFEKKKSYWQEKLDAVKSELDDILKLIKCESRPIVTMDTVEYLLNEYISLSKLICDNKIKLENATALGIKNFSKIYLIIEPYIELRRQLSPDFAIEFQVVASAGIEK